MSTQQELERAARHSSLHSLPRRVGSEGAATLVGARGVASAVALVRPGAEFGGDRPEAGLERQRVLRALLLARQVMVGDVPPVFSGTVEVDETYLGGKWRNKWLGERAQGTKRGRGTTKQAVFGILCQGGQVWAEVVPKVEARTLLPLLRQRVRPGSTVCSDTFTSYTGIAAGSDVHRLVDHTQAFSDRQGGHVNGLEGFWGYLKQRLAAKGGMRRERLPLYLAEYVRRYNHRCLSVAEQVKSLLKLVQSYFGG